MGDFMVKAKENAVILTQETKKVGLLSVILFVLFELWGYLTTNLFGVLCENYGYLCDVEKTKWYATLSIVLGVVFRYLKK